MHKEEQIIISTLENIPGMDIVQHLGVVSATGSLDKSILGAFVGGFKKLFGGEVEAESEAFRKLKEKIIEDLKVEAKLVDANAIICFRFTIGASSNNSLEAIAYGTAVKAVKF